MTDTTTATTAAWLERLEQIQANVQNRLGSDPSACMSNASLDDLIDLVRALAERVDSLQEEVDDLSEQAGQFVTAHSVDLAFRRHRDTAHLP